MNTRQGAAAIAALATALAVGTAAPPANAGTAGSAHTSAAGRAAVKVNFGLRGSAYGTTVRPGKLTNLSSGRTAYVYQPCSDLTGISKTNQAVGLGLGPQSSINGIKTRTWTTRTMTNHGVSVATHSKSTVANVVLGGRATGLVLKGLVTRSVAYHDNRGFHQTGRSTIASGTLNGRTVNPGRNDTIVVPGVASVKFFTGGGKVTGQSARVVRRGLRIALFDGTIVNVAGTFNEINNQIVAGIMSGYGRAATFQALDTVRSGKVAVQPLNCEGTNGKWITNSTADYNPTGRVDLQAASGSARGDVIDRTHVYAKTRGTIAKAVLGNLVIKGIRGQANVTRSGSKLTKTDKGTRLLSITNNGNTRPLPNPGQTIRIAGIGTLTFDKVNKGKYGLKVTAVQIKVLPGKFGDPDGATINLGEAYARISPK